MFKKGDKVKRNGVSGFKVDRINQDKDYPVVLNDGKELYSHEGKRCYGQLDTITLDVPTFKAGDRVLYDGIEYTLKCNIHRSETYPLYFRFGYDDRTFTTNGKEYIGDETQLTHVHKFEFSKGDIVEFGGIEGVVINDKENVKYKIKVKLTIDECTSYFVYFTADGMLFMYHTKPLLNLIKRPDDEITVDGVKYKRIES